MGSRFGGRTHPLPRTVLTTPLTKMTIIELPNAEQFLDGRHQHFRNIAAAVGSEVAGKIGLGSHTPSAALAACRNAFIFSRSFLPGALSMREQASTPHG